MPSSNGTHLVQPKARTVVVMGADSRADILAIAGAVAGQRGELLLLATGWPLTPAQQQTIEEATDAAATLRLPFEARLVYTEGDVMNHLLPDDIVVMPGTTQRRAQRPVPTFA
jgi:hypothetical protein